MGLEVESLTYNVHHKNLSEEDLKDAAVDEETGSISKAGKNHGEIKSSFPFFAPGNIEPLTITFDADSKSFVMAAFLFSREILT